MVRALREAWRQTPPSNVLLAWQLKYKPPPRPRSWRSGKGGSNEVLRGKALVDFMKAMGGTVSDPSLLVN